jgi:hypothetical protein
MDIVYTLRHNWNVANGIEFDWDAEKTKHLAAHKVTAREFESVLEISRWIWRTKCGWGRTIPIGWLVALRQIAGRHLDAT